MKIWFLPVIVFSILLVVAISYTPSVDAAQEVRKQYEDLSGYPGETITQTMTDTALSTNPDVMHSWKTVHGEIAGWISPKKLDFGKMDPGETGIDRDWTITIPSSASPGLYEFVWVGGCEIGRGLDCSFVYDVYFTLKIIGQNIDTYDYTITGEQGETILQSSMGGTAPATNKNTIHSWSEVTGPYAAWVWPRTHDFGNQSPGQTVPDFDWSVTIPANTSPGTYQISWVEGCETFPSGDPCTGINVYNYNVVVTRASVVPVVSYSTFSNDVFSMKYPSNWYVNDEVIFYDNGDIDYVMFTPKLGNDDTRIGVTFYANDSEWQGLSDEEYESKLVSYFEEDCNTDTYDNVGYICTDFFLATTDSIVDDQGNNWHSIVFGKKTKYPDGTVDGFTNLISEMPTGVDNWGVWAVFDLEFVTQNEDDFADIGIEAIKSFTFTNPITKPPTFPSGQVLENGKCVTPTTQCGPGEFLKNGICVPIIPDPPTCPLGQVLENDNCVSPGGQEPADNTIFIIIGAIAAVAVAAVGIALSKRKKTPPPYQQASYTPQAQQVSYTTPPPAPAADKSGTQFWVCPICNADTIYKDKKQYCENCQRYL